MQKGTLSIIVLYYFKISTLQQRAVICMSNESNYTIFGNAIYIFRQYVKYIFYNIFSILLI